MYLTITSILIIMESSNINKYICPITHQIFRDLVTAADGHIYEKDAIIKWLKKIDIINI